MYYVLDQLLKKNENESFSKTSKKNFADLSSANIYNNNGVNLKSKQLNVFCDLDKKLITNNMQPQLGLNFLDHSTLSTQLYQGTTYYNECINDFDKKSYNGKTKKSESEMPLLLKHYNVDSSNYCQMSTTSTDSIVDSLNNATLILLPD